MWNQHLFPQPNGDSEERSEASFVPVGAAASVLSTSGLTHLGFCAMSTNVHLVKKTMS